MNASFTHVLGEAFFADPYPTYARLREQPGPAFFEPEQTWLVSRYEQVAVVLKDARFSKQLPPTDRSPLSRTMLFQDPPRHRRLRESVAVAFTPQRIRQLTDHIGVVADRLIDGFERRGRVDFIADFAMPLPVSLIAEMLGVPTDAASRMCQWTEALVRAGAPGVTDQGVLQAGGAAIAAMAAFFSDRITDERRRPGETLLAGLLEADVEGGRLDDEELLGTCMLLMIAGHETTVNLLGNGLHLLLTHPDQRDLLQRQPELMPSAVEEMLRFESPVQRGTHRRTTEPVELGGTTIPTGSLVGALIGAANRDPEVFPEPDRLDIRRTPNPHLAFGNGVHYCLGATLAREEAAIGLSRLFARLPGVRLAPAAAVQANKRDWLRAWWRSPAPTDSTAGPLWKPNPIVRGLVALPIAW